MSNTITYLEILVMSQVRELRQVFPDRTESFLKRAIHDFSTVESAVEAVLDGLIPQVHSKLNF